MKYYKYYNYYFRWISCRS